MSERAGERPGSSRSFSFLVNPASGGGAASGAVVPVTRLLREAGAEVEVTYSPGPRATRELVRAATARGDVVVSVGGDGMLSSLAGEVAALGGTLGLVPAGRGNDFARMMGLPTVPAAVARLLLSAAPVPVDLVSVALADGSERTVVGSVYAGVDAVASEVVDRVHRLPRRVQYPWAAIRSLATFRPAAVTVDVDGERSSYRAATVVVANSAYYGSGMRIAPGASVTDGLLDVVVIEAAGRLDMIRSLPKVYDGSHAGLPGVHVRRGTTVSVRPGPGADRADVPVGGDGESLGRLGRGLRAQARPGALRVLA